MNYHQTRERDTCSQVTSCIRTDQTAIPPEEKKLKKMKFVIQNLVYLVTWFCTTSKLLDKDTLLQQKNKQKLKMFKDHKTNLIITQLFLV